MSDKVNHGELKEGIISVLAEFGDRMPARKIINKLANIGIFTTDDSLLVTLNKMSRIGSIHRDMQHRCECCDRRMHVYYL